MRILIVGASRIGVAVAQNLIPDNHSVVLIDQDKEKLDRLSETMDCGMVVGDGTSPAIIREAMADEDVDVLLALSNQDQDNILAALVGRSLGIERTIPQITNPELKHLCEELGLEEQFHPEEVVANQLHKMVGE